MSTLEREIIEKFHQLQPAAKQRIRALIEQETVGEIEQSQFDYEGWFRNIETLRQEIRTYQGNKPMPIDVVAILRDMRDGEDE